MNIPVMKKAVSAAPSMQAPKKEEKKSKPSSPEKTPPNKNLESFLLRIGDEVNVF